MDICTAVVRRDLPLLRQILSKQPGALHELVSWNSKSNKAENNARLPLGPSITEQDVYGALPLNLAVMREYLDMVLLLLDAGADPSIRDSRGRSALICAIYGGSDTLTITSLNYKAMIQPSPGHVQITEILLSKMTKDTFYDSAEAPQGGPLLRGISPLCLASYLGKLEMVRCLIDQGVNVNAKDANGATPLMYAGRDGHVRVVKLLLEKTASIEERDHHGWTAHQYGQAFPEITALLTARSNPRDKLSKSHTVNPSTQKELKPNKTMPATTAIHPKHFQLFSAVKGGNLDAFKGALSFTTPETVNFSDPSSGLTCLQYAARHRPLQSPLTETIIRLLISAGANANAKNENTGKTTLHYLLRDPFTTGSNNLNNGATVMTMDDGVNTQFIHQIEFQMNTLKSMVMSILRFLHRSGANGDESDHSSNRALHYASRVGDADIVQLLLSEFQVDVFAKNRRGRMAIDECTTVSAKRVLREWMDKKSPRSGVNLEEEINDLNNGNPPMPSHPPTYSAPISIKQNGASSVLPMSTTPETRDVISKSPDKDDSAYESANKSDPIEPVNEPDELDVTEFDEWITDSDDFYSLVQSDDPLVQKLIGMLQDSETRNATLLKELMQTTEVSSKRESALKSEILSLEERLTISETKHAQSSNDASNWKTYAENLELDKSMADYACATISIAYEKALVLATTLYNESESSGSELHDLKDLQMKYATWDHQVYLSSLESKDKLVFLDVEADILRLNLQCLCEEVKKYDDGLIGNRRQKALLMANAGNSGPLERDEDKLRNLDDEEDLILADIARLKMDQDSIQDQLEFNYYCRSDLTDAAERRGDSDSRSNQPKKRFPTIDELLAQLSCHYCSVFRTMNQDGEFGLDPVATVHVSPPSNSVSESVDLILSPLQLSQVLDSAKMRVFQLKDQLKSVIRERISLSNRLVESEKTAKGAASVLSHSEESKRATSKELEDVKTSFDNLGRKLDKIQIIRMKEVQGIRESLKILVGNSDQDNEEILVVTEGLLGSMKELIRELDPTALESLILPIDRRASEMGLAAPGPEDLNRYATEAIVVLSSAVARMKTYFDVLFTKVMEMKGPTVVPPTHPDRAFSNPKSLPKLLIPSRASMKNGQPSSSSSGEPQTPLLEVPPRPIITVSPPSSNAVSPLVPLPQVTLPQIVIQDSISMDTPLQTPLQTSQTNLQTTPLTSPMTSNESVQQYIDRIAKMKEDISHMEKVAPRAYSLIDTKKKEYKILVKQLMFVMRGETPPKPETKESPPNQDLKELPLIPQKKTIKDGSIGEGGGSREDALDRYFNSRPPMNAARDLRPRQS